MTNLVIDIGNTLSKAALFKNRELILYDQAPQLTLSWLERFFDAGKIDNVIVSSVKSDIREVEESLKQRVNFISFTSSTASNVINKYKTPHTLGLDRYAGVIGAEALFPGKNVLVIDAGTCITYDFISNEKEYRGGSISPGLKMRFKAMHEYTGRLPLVELENYADEFGNDTPTSILAGVQKGAYFEALGFIDYYNTTWPGLNVVLCGGDANFFDRQLKNSIFAHTLQTEPHLVLIGLNEVIHYNND